MKAISKGRAHLRGTPIALKPKIDSLTADGEFEKALDHLVASSRYAIEKAREDLDCSGEIEAFNEARTRLLKMYAALKAERDLYKQQSADWEASDRRGTEAIRKLKKRVELWVDRTTQAEDHAKSLGAERDELKKRVEELEASLQLNVGRSSSGWGNHTEQADAISED